MLFSNVMLIFCMPIKKILRAGNRFHKFLHAPTGHYTTNKTIIIVSIVRKTWYVIFYVYDVYV